MQTQHVLILCAKNCKFHSVAVVGWMIASNTNSALMTRLIAAEKRQSRDEF